ncbi:MAG: glycosyltransferase, partial [Romboutsia sp.]|nr:glycosyltransferase [Romboutsia sp.]
MSDKQKKIILINTEYKHKIGGVEKVVETLDTFLSDSKDFDVKIINTHNYGNISSTGVKRLIDITLYELKTMISPIDSEKKIYSVWFGRSTYLKSIVTPFRQFVNFLILKNLITNIKPDIINYHFVDDSVYLMSKIASDNKNFKLVTNVHGNDIEKFALDRQHRKCMKKVLINSDVIICNSDYIKKIIHKTFPSIELNKIKL